MGAQRFAIGVANERGTIGDLDGAALGGLEILRLGEEGEPAAEGLLVVWVVQAEKIGRAVAGGIGEVGRDRQGNAGGRQSRHLDAQRKAGRGDAGTDARSPPAGGGGDFGDGSDVCRLDGDARRRGRVLIDGERRHVVAIGDELGGL